MASGRSWRRHPPFLPQKEDGWLPYVWLVYQGFPIAYLVLVDPPPAVWIATFAVIAVFLPLYFLGHWVRDWRLLLVGTAVAALGAALVPWNGGANTYFVYAAAFFGYVAPVRRGVTAIVLLCLAVGLEAWIVGLHPGVWTAAIVFSLMIGMVNVYTGEAERKNARLRIAHDEVERLAKMAERERIARDLHDLLGHTLSLIAIKAELAEKLSTRDPERSAAEIRQVHQISREALTEVRRAVQGYRSEGSGGLMEEVTHAQDALEAAGVAVTVDGKPAVVAAAAGPAREAILALSVREAVTNVLRHARASQCAIHLAHTTERVLLSVTDEGRGGLAPEGGGLTGMRERVEALGGSFERSGERGTRLSLSLPLPHRTTQTPAAPAAQAS
jgi:two-component system sensor histidine kinase DesK